MPIDKGQILKLVIYRPHQSIWFRNPLKNVLRNRLLPNKYGPIFDALVDSTEHIYFCSLLNSRKNLKELIASLIDLVELYLWCIYYQINLNRVRIVFTKKAVETKDAIFLMYYDNVTHELDSFASKGMDFSEYFNELKIFKIVHMTHYVYNVKTGSGNLAKMAPDLVIAESNLKKYSDFYKRYFSKISANFYQLPYCYGKRFVCSTSFEDRINKIVATGSLTFKMHDPEFIEFYKVNELQPFRRVLFECCSRYPSELDSYISDLNETRIKFTHTSILSRVKNLFGRHPQHSYYKKDIVSIYNSYQMFVVPEEICDLPAIGFVEGMACGCAYFGINSPMYSEIGMVPGYHYIEYDGTIDGLMLKVRYYQRNVEELRQIANNGHDFVRNTLSSKIVTDNFISEIKKKLLQLRSVALE